MPLITVVAFVTGKFSKTVYFINKCKTYYFTYQDFCLTEKVFLRSFHVLYSVREVSEILPIQGSLIKVVNVVSV